jgi:uncharacterized membrane protein YgdD (TMEM256/DUF423 family)
MDKWQRASLVMAGISGAAAVLMGAAAAHWLQASMDAAAIARIEKAATYQIYHSLVLLGLSVLPSCRPLRMAVVLMVVGILCFSGSLYLYSFSGLYWLVWITPIGGMAWILGWLAIAAAGFLLRCTKNAGQSR